MKSTHQRGVAVITALLLTTLAVTIVASLFWQQQVQVRAIENQRMQLQKQWILRGALDWAQLILRTSTQETVTLQQEWAVGLAETRLDSYVENGRADSEASDATITGKIIDAQSLLNLRNLVVNGSPSPPAMSAFKELLKTLKLDPELADATLGSMLAVQPKTPSSSNGSSNQDVVPKMVAFDYVEDLLAVPGFTIEIVNKLRGFVIFLPKETFVNINTASAEVLHASVQGLSLDRARTIVLYRNKIPFRDINSMKDYLKDNIEKSDSNKGENDGTPDGLQFQQLNITSNYFLVDGKVKLNRAGLDVRALIERSAPSPGKSETTKVLWVHENQ